MNEKKDKSAEIDNLRIEPLSDEDLESVAGGMAAGDSCSCCEQTSGCTSGLAQDVT
jgi:hypothetical protein